MKPRPPVVGVATFMLYWAPALQGPGWHQPNITRRYFSHDVSQILILIRAATPSLPQFRLAINSSRATASRQSSGGQANLHAVCHLFHLPPRAMADSAHCFEQ
jgi:hypothetical protein